MVKKSPSNNLGKHTTQAVGFNLRPEWLDFVIREQPALGCLEIIVDNWLSPGPHHQKLEKVRQDYDLLFHCVGMNLGGEDPLDQKYFDELKSLIKCYEPLHISDHLCFQHHDGHYFHDLLPIPLNEESLIRCQERVEKVFSLLDKPLCIENLSYYVQYDNSTMGEGEFLSHLCKNTGAKVLLDLNNIWVNEQNLGLCYESFMSHLGDELIGEIHLAGPEKVDELYVDTHCGLVRDEVKHRYKQLVQKLSVPVIYERDHHLPTPHDMVNICQALSQGI